MSPEEQRFDDRLAVMVDMMNAIDILRWKMACQRCAAERTALRAILAETTIH